MTYSDRIDRLAAFVHEDRIIRCAWTCKEDGQVAVCLLGGPELGSVSLAWDWRSMRWIGRRPGPEGAP